jgi:hypothetical protein
VNAITSPSILSSVMRGKFAGLSATPDSVNAAERYYLANGLKGKTYCNLVENSPCGSAFVISYSDGSGAALDENRLSEAANIGYGSVFGAYADWNNSNSLTNGIIARNINPLDGTGRTVLTDYDEWSNLKITFSRSYAGSNSGEALTATAPVRQPDPMSERAHNKITEALPPAELLTTLRNLAPPHCDRNDNNEGARTH